MNNPKPQKYYIGIACGFHDGAIALVNEKGEIVFAEATERFTQNKRSFSSSADNYFLSQKILQHFNISDYELALNWRAYDSTAKVTMKSLVNYIFRNKINLTTWFAKNIRKQLPDKYLASLDLNFTNQLSTILMAGVSIRNLLVTKKGLKFKRAHYFDHHLTHAYYSFFTSTFQEALILVIDGNGDSNSSLSLYQGKNQNFDLLFRNKNKCSLGDYYGIITQLCGFDFHAGEQWKVMGLAPYGKLNETFLNILEKWIEVDQIGIRYITNYAFDKLQTALKTTGNISAQDIAYTGQFFYETVLIKLLENIYKKFPEKNLIITGGCALNSAANGKVHTLTPFKNVFIPSAPADDGCSIGAALLNFKKNNKSTPIPHFQTNPYLGFSFSDEEINQFITYSGYKYEIVNNQTLYKKTAECIFNGKVVAWIQGRAEMGPRALGNRSILANPCLPEMKDKLNSRVKFREEFRPFAPAVLEEHANEYFENYYPTPYMERVLEVKDHKKSQIPAVTHVDGTGRLQTVARTLNEPFHQLISEFHSISGVPVLLNTSLNVMGKPIVNSISDVAGVFALSGIDIIVAGNYIIYK